MTRQELVGPLKGSDAVIRSFTAPRPLIEALREHADARGQSMSRVIREALVNQGIVPAAFDE